MVLGTAENVGLGLAALGLVGIGVTVVQRRRSSDATCGCASTCSVDGRNAQVSCTLDHAGGLRRIAEFREVFDRAYLGSERVGDASRWRFQNQSGLVDELQQLAAKEMACCQFFDFQVRTVGNEIWWDIRTPTTAKPVAEEFFALPQRVATTDTGELVERLGKTFMAVGGHFGPGKMEARP